MPKHNRNKNIVEEDLFELDTTSTVRSATVSTGAGGPDANEAGAGFTKLISADGVSSPEFDDDTIPVVDPNTGLAGPALSGDAEFLRRIGKENVRGEFVGSGADAFKERNALRDAEGNIILNPDGTWQLDPNIDTTVLYCYLVHWQCR
jgi:hypothetical protein